MSRLESLLDQVEGRAVSTAADDRTWDSVGFDAYRRGSGPIFAVPPEESGHMHLYYVTNIDEVAPALDESWAAGEVTAAIVELFVDADGTQVLRQGDTIVGYSSPGVDGLSPGEALRRTLEYDVDDLMKATGWTRERAEEWTRTAPPVPLSKLLPDVDLPRKLAERRGNELRARNTWRFSVKRDDGFMMFFYVRAA